ncbi:MAG: GIY-YIG nuclease family protein [Planctomycetota bacterium]|nr:GIY-YIG nuclease family protein [Planctomycetota bacterium]
MTFHVYVLRCSDKSLYADLTNNLQRRLREHLLGKVSWTKTRLHVTLAYSERANTRFRAQEREKYLKNG